VEITIVGSGCAIPDARRGSPCVAAGVGGKLIVFDCGPGAPRAMASAGLDWQAIDTVFITHFHTDHIAGLAQLLFVFNIPDTLRTKPLTLFGPPGLRQLHDRTVAAYGQWLVPKQYELRIEEIGRGPVERDGWRVATVPAEHSQPAYAYRFEAGGASMVYSGDTDYSESIVALASGCDLLILECSYPNDIEVAGHLTPRKAGEMARRAGYGKLVLTHLYPICAGYDLAAQCREVFSGDVAAAEDGMRFVIGS
jgi:ribonuclease BN (tRNA processing enzyme)